MLFLLRHNPVQEAAAELFGISQATVSRRWAALLPVVEKIAAVHVPDPVEASAERIVLVDGTLVTTWDWASEGTRMFSGRHRAPGSTCRSLRPSPYYRGTLRGWCRRFL
ncbi:transposase family protein [Streptomyces sp. NPDC001817]|uniref:transposase family protein n=1 Tax=Streptomyces sp. NPDC001817 TaxID=3154398 RepID=UPI003316EEC5